MLQTFDILFLSLDMTPMKPREKAIGLLSASIAWIYLFGCFSSRKDDPFESQFLNYALGGFVFVAPLILPVLGYFLVRGQQRTILYKTFLFPAFVLSLVPAAIFLFLFGVLIFVPAPK